MTITRPTGTRSTGTRLTDTRQTGVPAPAVMPTLDQVTQQRVSVVIPALNEARNLPHVFAAPARRTARGHRGGRRLDRRHRGRRPRSCARTSSLVTQTRKGKGNALACGFAAATGDIIVMIDADGSTDPAEIPRFVAALVAGADFAKGSRFIPGGGSATSPGCAGSATTGPRHGRQHAVRHQLPTCATATTPSGAKHAPGLRPASPTARRPAVASSGATGSRSRR